LHNFYISDDLLTIFLSELSGEYLALTGAILNAKEMISVGLATHFVSSEVRHSAVNISTLLGFDALFFTCCMQKIVDDAC
jgi:enoyl-CoA hydratase/carnithine racemase